MKHPRTVPGYNGSLEQLAKDLENLSYDSLADFLKYLETALIKRSESDKIGGRTSLSGKLENAAKYTNLSEKEIREAWEKYCKNK